MSDALTVGMVDARPPATRDNLERIADALGCPATAFRTGEGLPADLAARHELLTLWDSLKTEAGRQAVLKLVRAIAANE